MVLNSIPTHTHTHTPSTYLKAGSFGFVFKTEENTALKVTFLDTTNNQDEEKRSFREYHVMKGKLHENIVQVLSLKKQTFTHPQFLSTFSSVKNIEEIRDQIAAISWRAKRHGSIQSILLEMELCGRDLRTWLNTPEFNVHTPFQFYPFQLGIVEGLVDGMKFLHHKGIMHRDLKPENVMFSRSKGNDGFGFELPVKIGDFGSCRMLLNGRTKMMPSQFYLTPEQGAADYLAPEARTSCYTFSADLFSLGLIIWEVVQLIPSHKRRPLMEKLMLHGKTKLVGNHPLIYNIRRVLIKLTKKNVSQRLPNISLLVLNTRRKVAKNSSELRKCLKLAEPGDVIEVREGVYNGPFKLHKDSVVLEGVGQKSIFTNGGHDNASPVFHIEGNNCRLNNVHFALTGLGLGLYVVGSKNKISHLEISGSPECKGISVNGHKNTVSNVVLANLQNGVDIKGNGNNLRGIKLTNIFWTGVGLCGDRNSVTNLLCGNAKCGVRIDGNYNSLGNMDIFRNALDKCCPPTLGKSVFGIWVFRGSRNSIWNVDCRALDAHDYGLYFSFCDRTKVKSCNCGEIYVGGGTHSFENVKNFEKCAKICDKEQETVGKTYKKDWQEKRVLILAS